MSDDFAFPTTVQQSVKGSAAPAPEAVAAPRRLPLTAFSTVTHVSGAVPSAEAEVESDSDSGSHKVPVEKAQSQVEYLRLNATNEPRAALRDDISLEELAQHVTVDDAWVCLKGKVYDMTTYLKYHPGGVRILLKAAGTDATALFAKHHAWVDADYILSKSAVGKLQKAESAKPLQEDQQHQPAS